MTQLVVTLENGADSSFLSKIIENLKGVIGVSSQVINTANIQDKKTEEWIKKMRSLSKKIDKSVIDGSDERTQYILSK
ncbi:MAG: hypothetical protein NC095_08660 [Muribaculum sp.]|nr:hypothetical protein [Muribaculum sp.]